MCEKDNFYFKRFSIGVKWKAGGMNINSVKCKVVNSLIHFFIYKIHNKMIDYFQHEMCTDINPFIHKAAYPLCKNIALLC